MSMLPDLRIRKLFAAGFVVTILLGAFLGLAPAQIPQYKQSDKVLHFLTCFTLTVCFYWTPETSRRRMINLTLLVCTAGIGIGSEILQGLLPNGRLFDPFDIVANVLGSGAALLMCAWYHRRMLERKRAKRYQIISGEDGDENLGVELRDEEHEIGVVDARAEPTVTEQLDNWDENAEDWEDEAHAATPATEEVAADTDIKDNKAATP